MRGHETLLQLRKEGLTPKIVFINDYPCETDWFKWGEHATVCVAGDGLESIDFRFAKGLTLSITAANKKRAQALFDLGKASGAKAVGCGSDDGFNQVWSA